MTDNGVNGGVRALNGYNAPKNQDNFSKDLISSSVGTLAYSF